ncbi:MAG TPA: DUF885 domain-containing protein [Acidimicrobiia bacterium]|nr:DUF885 domain-containing protein [Acidimicrobiia bacterium]
MQELDDLSTRYWDLILASSPTTATLLGDRRFDDQLDDISPMAFEQFVVALTQIINDVELLDPTAMERQDRITSEVLLSEANNQITLVETGILAAACDPLTGPVFGLLQTTAQTAAADAEQAEKLLMRYRQVPRYLEDALTRHSGEAAAGRPPVATNVRRVISQVDNYLATAVEGDPFAVLPGPTTWDGYESWRHELKTLTVESIRPAFARYGEGVAALLPLCRHEDQPGVSYLKDGEEIYQRLINVFTSLPYGARELHEIGREEIEGTLAARFGELGERAFGDGDLTRILNRLRTDPSLRYTSADDIVAHAEEIVTRAWEAAGAWFNLRPIEPCVVQPVPASLAQDAPPAYYFPPARDGSRPGVYFINTYQPEERYRYAAEATAFHEASPGHHFQLTLAAELTGIPEFRQHALTVAYVEGWGLYAERLADEMNLYSSDLDLLGMVSAEAWRSARLVVDTGIHALGWSRRRAVDYLHRWTAIDPITIETEVDRYIGVPGQALAYKVGQREFLRLRQQAEELQGDAFDVKAFHDTVLGSGPLPLPVLQELVTEWLQGST